MIVKRKIRDTMGIDGDVKDSYASMHTQEDPVKQRCQIKAQMAANAAKIRVFEMEIDRSFDSFEYKNNWNIEILSEIRKLKELNKNYLKQLIEIGL